MANKQLKLISTYDIERTYKHKFILDLDRIAYKNPQDFTDCTGKKEFIKYWSFAKVAVDGQEPSSLAKCGNPANFARINVNNSLFNILTAAYEKKFYQEFPHCVHGNSELPFGGSVNDPGYKPDQYINNHVQSYIDNINQYQTIIDTTPLQGNQLTTYCLIWSGKTDCSARLDEYIGCNMEYLLSSNHQIINDYYMDIPNS